MEGDVKIAADKKITADKKIIERCCKNGTLKEPALCTFHHANFWNTLQNPSKFISKFFDLIFEMLRYNFKKFPKYFSEFFHKIILEVF